MLEKSDLVVMQQIILAGIERKMFFPQEMDSINILFRRIQDSISPPGETPGFTVMPATTPLQSTPLQSTPLQGIPENSVGFLPGPSPLR